MKFLPSHKVHTLFQTANSPRGIADTTKQLVLAGALVLAPATVTAQVTEATRAKIVELQASDPGFKLKTFHRGCLDGSIVDPNCEEGVKGHMNNYIGRKEVNAREAQVNAEKAQVNAEKAQLLIIDEIISHLDISLAMLQLANYIEFDEPIPRDKDKVALIINSDKAPQAVREFLKNMKAKKDAKIAMRYNPEGKELLGHIKTHVDAAFELKEKLTIKDKNYESIEQQIALARNTYSIIVQSFAKKTA